MPNIPMANLRELYRYLLGKVGRVESLGVYMYLTLLYLILSKGEIIYYMHLHASS